MPKCLWCGKEFEAPVRDKHGHSYRRFCSANCYLKWAYKYDEKYHQKRLEAFRRYRERNRARIRIKARGYYRRNRPIKERQLHPLLRTEFPDIMLFDEVTPDGYIPNQKMFCEVKLARTKRNHEFYQTSKYFDGLFFPPSILTERKSRILDEQIAEYPKPLLVIVFDARSGREITRRLFE